MRKLFAIVSLMILAGIVWYHWSLRPANASDAVRQSISIEKGSSVASIANLLEEKGIIRSARAFTFYTRLHGLQSSLQAGDFILRPSMSVEEIIEALKRGFSEEITITIPEGFTVKDIDELLAKKELITAGEFIACAQTCEFTDVDFLPKGNDMAKRGGNVEGYLFPDTYFVIRENFTSKGFIDRLLVEFKRRVIDGLAQDLKESKRSLHEIVIMASLIEEEAKKDEERTVISGILWKRFDRNVGLGVDASNRYILEKPTAAITEKDLDQDSPYNLRKYRGLPPGAIANPGIESIKAALHPTESPYLYYLHGTDGTIRYAETNDEHNMNKQLYLK